MTKYLGKCFLTLILLLASDAGVSSESKESAAEQAAVAWLALIDSEHYEASWNQAASLFQSKVSDSQWNEALTSGRKPLGALVSRELISATYSTSLPGVPEGEYVVLQFQTEFEAKPEAVETVTPMLDGEDWKVSGYFIK